MGPQNRSEVMHPDTMIEDFRALLDNRQDATHHVVLYSCMREFNKNKSRNKMDISDEPLHTMQLCIYHCIKVPVQGTHNSDVSMHRKPDLAGR
jgi:hypothetical protein